MLLDWTLVCRTTQPWNCTLRDHASPCMTGHTVLLSARKTQNANDLVEQYNVFNNSAKPVKVSLFDGGKPLAYFSFKELSKTGIPGNFTWAAIVSSVNRTSYWPGTDQWYRTGDSINRINTTTGTTRATFYKVKPCRPALSCWQNDV